jgi:glucose/arabinose dehydrogenase
MSLGSKITHIFIALTALALPALGQTPQVADPQPGDIFVTPRIDLGLQPVPLQVPAPYASAALRDRELFLPPGFVVKVFAAGGPLFGPRYMAWSPEGVLHVANMKVGGGEWAPEKDTSEPPPRDQMRAQVVALPDEDNDGVADEMRVVADQLWFPNSIQFHGDFLYVADMHQVVRLRDGDGDGFYEAREVVVPDLPTGHHRTRTIQIDAAREKLYVSIGSSCDLCRETDARRATVMEFNLDGSDGRIFATGLRNAVGLDIHPVTGELWGTFNGHDRSAPPERIDIIRDGAFYGWPLAHGYRTWIDFAGQSSYRNEIFPLTAQDSALVETVPRPVAQAGVHLGPMGIHFYRGERFPETYRNAAFVAFRGGSNAAVPGQKVLALFSDPDGRNARLADFLLGFQPTVGSGSGVWGKPVGLTTDVRGNLYVSSDWINHMILRIELARLRGSWQGELPAEVLTGGRIDLDVTIRIEAQAEGGESVRVVADLSAFGIEDAVPLEMVGDGEFRLRRPLEIGEIAGERAVEVVVRQVVGDERLEMRLRRVLRVFPGRDLMVIGEGLALGWQVDEGAVIRWLGTGEDSPEFRGAAVALDARDVTFSGWSLALTPEHPLAPLGFKHVRFAFHPGDAGATRGARLNLIVKPGRNINLLEEGGIDLTRAEWQVVEIPLETLELTGPIESLLLQGSLEGRFYIDELALVTATPRPADTAVAEEHSQPQVFSLTQNYPNPFNSGTVIRYTTAADGPVELSVYNLTGQRVAQLQAGWLAAGAHALAWDGRGRAGEALASGVYIYRLQTSAGVDSRKLLLLR